MSKTTKTRIEEKTIIDVIPLGRIGIAKDGTIVHSVTIPIMYNDSKEEGAIEVASIYHVTGNSRLTFGHEGIEIICENYIEVHELLTNRFPKPTTQEEKSIMVDSAMEIISDFLVSNAEYQEMYLRKYFNTVISG